ncbi:hypothetical protein A9P82_03800 [Arachidicoccus ginsenosidimutans]|uniref:TetR/AcrR family transcriptional regulator n=1 Tax=Arachidicoccus sp. BS20 TaxID=1850526 RepID=UPI0007F170BB|nr:TetR/AcrR family transcriptional regulator [Arachidicoccus sp. BS20]ANI88498.1 hypothetical protein A9P82_03800 [Arachidicoccus sp. BS20]
MSSIQTTQEDILPEQILQAALQLYLKHGIKKVTMDDVSKVIGKTRSSLYYYYKNKDEIFEAVMEALVREVINEISAVVNTVDSIEDKIRAFCLSKIKTSEDRKALFVALETGMDADEISKHATAMITIHKLLMKQEASLLKKVLSASAKSGEVRALKPKEQDTFTFIIQSGIRGIKREMSHDNDFSKLNTTVDILTAMAAKWLKE